MACHGTDGIGILPEYPNLTGQHADYLEESLRAYRSGQRKNAVMAGMTAALTDEDIEELARYYAARSRGSARRIDDPRRAVAASRCDPVGNGVYRIDTEYLRPGLAASHLSSMTAAPRSSTPAPRRPIRA